MKIEPMWKAVWVYPLVVLVVVVGGAWLVVPLVLPAGGEMGVREDRGQDALGTQEGEEREQEVLGTQEGEDRGQDALGTQEGEDRGQEVLGTQEGGGGGQEVLGTQEGGGGGQKVLGTREGGGGGQEAQGTMRRWQAGVLGVVEGLTEYLPVSSTGHLVVAARLMGMGYDGDKEASDAYAICIQAGAILAVLVLYWGRMKQMAVGLAGRDAAGRRMAVAVMVAFVPAAVVGLLFKDAIKEHLFGLWPVVVAWAVGGGAILLLQGGRLGKAGLEGERLEELTWRGALVIGLFQCVAMWPGVSRSFATILGGVLAGLAIPAAVEFSFLLGLVTLLAATGYEAVGSWELIVSEFGWVNPAIGFLLAFVSAVVAVRWMVAYLNRHGLGIFGWYRLGAAVVVAWLIWSGIVRAS